MSMTFDNWKWVAEKLGVPTLFAVVLLTILHFDLMVPIQDGIKQGTEFQKQAVVKLGSIEDSQKRVEYDIRYGTWRVAPTPAPESLPKEAPPPPQPQPQP